MTITGFVANLPEHGGGDPAERKGPEKLLAERAENGV